MFGVERNKSPFVFSIFIWRKLGNQNAHKKNKKEDEKNSHQNAQKQIPETISPNWSFCGHSQIFKVPGISRICAFSWDWKYLQMQKLRIKVIYVDIKCE